MRNNEIDLVLVLEILRKRWWAIVLCAVIGASIALSYSRFLVTDVYKSTVTMYIDPKSTDQISSITYQSAAINYVKAVMDTNIKLLQTRDFMKNVADELRVRFGEEKYPESQFTWNSLSKMITVTAVENTKLFDIAVQSTDKEAAFDIAIVAQELAAQRLQDIADANVVTVADPPIRPTAPSNNNTNRNTLIGFLLGAVIAFGVLLLVELFDVRIKSEEDFINTYNIPLLGSVPNFEKAYKTKNKTFGKTPSSKTKPPKSSSAAPAKA